MPAALSNIHSAVADDFDARVTERSHTVAVLVDFWAAWCGPCRQLAPILEQIAERFPTQLDIVKVDTDAEQALARAHGIRSLPTMRVYRDGELVHEIVGLTTASALQTALEPFLPGPADDDYRAAHEALESGDLIAARTGFERALRTDENDHRSRLGLAEVILREGDPVTARTCMEALPAQLSDANATTARRLSAMLDFCERASQRPRQDLESLLQSVESTGPTRAATLVELAAHDLSTGDIDVGVERLLESLRLDRTGTDARQDLLRVFELLGDDPRVRAYRRQMASTLN